MNIQLAAASALQRQAFTLPALLASGGDERICPDPSTGRNKYGTTVAPAPAEICFSSSTATTISQLSFRAVKQKYDSLFKDATERKCAAGKLCDDVRLRLKSFFGLSKTEVVLAASGTDAELITLALVERLCQQPVTNIVVAPTETGSGVLKAAQGLNFNTRTSMGCIVEPGRRLAGWKDADIDVATVDIRSPNGAVRPANDVDCDAANKAERALSQGRCVLLHILDTSKTGLNGVSRQTAAEIVRLAPSRVQVVVDACQLRCRREQIKSDLAKGFIVVITGSKFAGGPAFSGALLLPLAIAAQLRDAPPPPLGLADYSASHDWPMTLRSSFARGLRSFNVGMALRWMAALAELERLASVSPELQQEIISYFEAAVCDRALKLARPLVHHERQAPQARSIVPLFVRGRDGMDLDLADAKTLQAELRKPIFSGMDRNTLQRVFHIGQPVTIGERAVLRVCASASQLADVAERVSGGGTIDKAFAPIACDLDNLFAKWTALMDRR